MKSPRAKERQGGRFIRTGPLDVKWKSGRMRALLRAKNSHETNLPE